MEKKLSSKEIVDCIISYKRHFLKNADETKEYFPLIKFLTAIEDSDDEVYLRPTLKEISNATGFSISKTRNFISEIYQDLILDSEKIVFNYREVEYRFFVKAYGEYGYFITESLPVLPRVGEHIQIRFLKTQLNGFDNFYVDDIQYYMEDMKQVILIKLKVGRYNKYWQFRKDEAEEKGEVSFMELYRLTEDELKKKLKIKK